MKLAFSCAVLAIVIGVASCSPRGQQVTERPAEEMTSSDFAEVAPQIEQISSMSASEDSESGVSSSEASLSPILDVQNDNTITNGSDTYYQSYITKDTETGCSYVTNVFVVNNGNGTSVAMNTFKRALPCKKK